VCVRACAVTVLLGIALIPFPFLRRLQVSLPVVQTFMMVHNKTGYGVNFHQFLLICATIGTPPPLRPSTFGCGSGGGANRPPPPPCTAQGRSLFQWRDTQRSGRITVTLDQLLELVIPFPSRSTLLRCSTSLYSPLPSAARSTIRSRKCRRWPGAPRPAAALEPPKDVAFRGALSHNLVQSFYHQYTLLCPQCRALSPQPPCLSRPRLLLTDLARSQAAPTAGGGVQ
jgi:hypothetical protein